ncbi:MAG TPA: carbohydrate ABC transporter permease [Acidimicrobiales bacterium]|nr:carbohydrate ABC transporter permease [Acidimicrobiales bacterium]
MTTIATTSPEAADRRVAGSPPSPAPEPVGSRMHRILGAIPTGVLWALVALWTIPTVGMLVSSFRPEIEVKTTGWWTVFPDPFPESVVLTLLVTIVLIAILVALVVGLSRLYLRLGRAGRIAMPIVAVAALVVLLLVTSDSSFTLENYRSTFDASTSDSPDMWQHALNSVAITVPATVIPIAFAAFAAYAFAWMDFPGRHWLFIGVVALLAVPIQLSLVPLLQLFTGGAHLTLFGETITLFPFLDLAGTTTAVWLTHIGFGLPLAIFLLHNYISSLPADVFEAARIDGADHPTIFWRLVLPLSVPALAAFAIFQFLWVWNDYLVASTFLGTGSPDGPMTVRLATLSGGRGQDWHLLTAAAFVSIALPLVVFFALQRYFVRGLLAGSVKG